MSSEQFFPQWRYLRYKYLETLDGTTIYQQPNMIVLKNSTGNCITPTFYAIPITFLFLFDFFNEIFLQRDLDLSSSCWLQIEFCLSLYVLGIQTKLSGVLNYLSKG